MKIKLSKSQWEQIGRTAGWMSNLFNNRPTDVKVVEEDLSDEATNKVKEEILQSQPYVDEKTKFDQSKFDADMKSYILRLKKEYGEKAVERALEDPKIKYLIYNKWPSIIRNEIRPS